MGSLQQIDELENENILGQDQSCSRVLEDQRLSSQKSKSLNKSYKVGSFTRIVEKQNQQQMQLRQSNHSPGSKHLNLDETTRPTPTSKQMREYNERNSMSFLLGIQKQKKKPEPHSSPKHIIDSIFQQKLTSRSQFYQQQIQAQQSSKQQLKINMQKPIIQNNDQKLASGQLQSKIFNQVASKKRESIGVLPSELNVEVTTKWIPKSALAKLNLPENFILENMNAMMNIAALEKSPEGSKSVNFSKMRESFNLSDAISNKRLKLGSSTQEKRKAQSERILVEQDKGGSKEIALIQNKKEIKKNENQDKSLYQKTIEQGNANEIPKKLHWEQDGQGLEGRRRIASAQQFRSSEEYNQKHDNIRGNNQISFRKYGAFVEFSKIGPARSITSLQTRTNYLFNRRNQLSSASGNNNNTNSYDTPQQKTSRRNEPMEIYKDGLPISTDITKWKKLNNSGIKHSNSGCTFSQQNEHVNMIASSMNLNMEKESNEVLQGKDNNKQLSQYKIRSNLDNIVKNIRKINLMRSSSSYQSERAQTHSSNRIKEQTAGNIKFIQHDTEGQDNNKQQQQLLLNFGFQKQNNTMMLDYQSQEGSTFKSSRDSKITTKSANLIISHQNSTFFAQTGAEKLNQQSDTQLVSSSSRISQSTHDFRLKNEEPDMSSPTSIFAPSPQSKWFQSPKNDNKRTVGFIQFNPCTKNEGEETETANTKEQQQQQQEESEAKNPIKVIKFQDRYQVLPRHLRQKFEAKNTNPIVFTNTHSQEQLLLQPNIAKNMIINKELTMKAYNKAIGEIKKAEYEDETLLFDPKAEQIKRKRRAKEKMLIVLLRCSRMHIKTNEIESVSRLSTVPYQNKGSFFFIESVKKNQLDTITMLLGKNKCFVSDFDQYHLTGLHYACKKGYLDMAKLLIDKGADINAVDSMKRTPLFYALINENKPLIKELLCNRCSPWSGDSFFFLKSNLSSEIWKILKYAKGANVVCKLTRNLSDRASLWKAQCQVIRNM